jgi:RecB family exonuclease
MQQRTLIRARQPHEFRDTLVRLCLEGPPAACRRRLVIVPTEAAAELLRQSIEAQAAVDGRAGVVLPDFVTRDGWLQRLHGALPGAPPLLSRLEREVLFERAAHAAARRRPAGAPFELRPGLVTAMLAFYDELRRRQRTIRRFARAVFDELRAERGMDRGSESLIEQTCFLGFASLAYARAAEASGGLDEHMLGARVLAEQPALGFDHQIVAVADHPSDPRGLWPADFDLLGRLRPLARLDVVVTDEAHDVGFRERMERELPGIVEARAEPVSCHAPAIWQSPDEARPRVFVSRDREEELRDLVRAIRASAESTGGVLTDRTAIVFQRPLPYLYLAQQVLADGRVPYQALDALPLAAEPYAALLDLALAAARTGATREPVIALLDSPLLRFTDDVGDAVTRRDAAALDRLLIERRATGDATTFADEVGRSAGSGGRPGHGARAGALRAARVAASIATELEPFRTADRASAQISALHGFLCRHERVRSLPDDEWTGREARARGGVLGALDALREAYQRHDDRRRDPDALAARIHQAIESHTFAPRRGTTGVQLIDGVAARFGSFDRVCVVGLVETEWPERPRRTVFYGSALLKSLGWPQDAEQIQAQQAAFRDLLRLAWRETRLSAFQFEGDSVVAVSPLIELADDLPVCVPPEGTERRLFSDEILTAAEEPIGLDAGVERWLRLRRARPALSDRRYAGGVGAQPPQAYRVSRVDRYVDCPFKYFAAHVLQLPEDVEAESGLTPLERGTLLHGLFEAFYREWHASGAGAITAASLPDAVARFTRLVHDTLARLPEADRALEEARLLGSMVGTGVAERVFELEVDQGAAVTDRQVERELVGTFEFPRLNGLEPRPIAIRGKADRIDVLADGSLRVVDYKLGRMPDIDASVQIAVYAHAARQLIEREDGRPHPIAAAQYLAFGDDRRLEGSLGDRRTPAGLAVEARASAFAAAIEQIEAGAFPARPRHVSDCAWCRYAGVCRKEYPSGEPHEPVDTV